ncbi:MAG: arylsulfatase [Myxococcota bacterium]
MLQAGLSAGIVGCSVERGGVRGGGDTGAAAGSTGSLGDTAAWTTSTTPASSGPPNILYIYLDQLRWDALGCAGHPVVLTPAIDALAARSVQFGRCYTNSPLCMPARAVMITGRLPGVTGVTNNLSSILPGGPSHVRRLRDVGYHTGVVGKVHLFPTAGHKDNNLEYLDRLGFSQTVETAGARMSASEPSAYTDWLSATTLRGRVDKYAKYQRYIKEYLEGPHAVGVWTADGIDAHGFRTADHLDAFVARRARTWLQYAPADQPWYLQVNFAGPHPPWDATAAYRALYDADDPALSVPPDRDPTTVTGLVQRVLDGRALPRSDAEKRATLVAYYAQISMVDALVASVLDALERSGQSDNTWVVLHADHGEQAGDKNLVGKMVFFEPSVRVPLLVRPPGGAAPWTSDALCDQLDVTRTLLAIGGADRDEPGPRSLLSTVLDGPDAPGAHTGKAAVVSQVHDSSMVLLDHTKVTFEAGRATELYDHRDDPEEWDNRVHSGERAGDVAMARDALRDALTEA